LFYYNKELLLVYFMYFTNCRAEPPRPSPGAVVYSADNMPPSYDDCSVTEKGDMSSDEDDDETKVSPSGYATFIMF